MSHTLPAPWQVHQFASEGDRQLHLDYLPPPQSSSRPFLFWVHGGGFMSLNRRSYAPWYLGLAKKLGWGFVSVDYRLCPGATVLESAHDVLDGWTCATTKLEGIDGRKGVVISSSSGVWQAMHLCASASPRPCALINLYGITDIASFSTPAPSPTSHPFLEPPHVSQVEAALEASMTESPALTGMHFSFRIATDLDTEAWKALGARNGMTLQEWHGLEFDREMVWEPEILRALMIPLAINRGLLPHVTQGGKRLVAFSVDKPSDAKEVIDHHFPPTITLHGTADTYVPHMASEVLQTHLEKAGIRHELILVPDLGHNGDASWDQETAQVEQVRSFISECV